MRTEKDYVTAPLELAGSKVNVALDLEHRQKGLLWYSTYKVVFAADYELKNTTDVENVDFVVTLPTAQASFDEMIVAVDGAPVAFINEKSTLRGSSAHRPRRKCGANGKVSISGAGQLALSLR